MTSSRRTSFSAGARVWTVVAACLGAAVATTWTGACTTRVVNFAAQDAGRTPEAPVAPVADAPPAVTPVADAPPVVTPVADAPSADVPGEAAPPDSSPVASREITPPVDDPFPGLPPANGPGLYVEYKCCNDEGSVCTIWMQGDGVTCRDAETWTMAASNDCKSRGFNAAGIGLYVGC